VDLGYPRDIESKYQWGKELGKGGNGVVREVTNVQTSEVFACKAIRKMPAGDVSDKKKAGHIDSIRRELEVLRRLSGSLNVVRLVDVFEDEHSVYVVQELCKGGELWHRIGERHYSERTVSGQACRRHGGCGKLVLLLSGNARGWGGVAAASGSAWQPGVQCMHA
jgi:calcium-dependent protein kinase